MIPASAITMKSATDLKPGEMGYYFTPSPAPFVAGLIQPDMIRLALFAPDQIRVLSASNLTGPVAVIAGAEIEVDPRSGRKASHGHLSGCFIFSGSNRLLELEYQSDFYQFAFAPLETSASSDRIAFERWRIVLRHDGVEYEILNRAPAAE